MIIWDVQKLLPWKCIVLQNHLLPPKLQIGRNLPYEIGTIGEVAREILSEPEEFDESDEIETDSNYFDKIGDKVLRNFVWKGIILRIDIWS